MDSHRLQEDLPIFDQLPDLDLDLPMGADICGFISLLEPNQASFFSTVDDTGGEPLVKSEHIHGYDHRGERKE